MKLIFFPLVRRRRPGSHQAHFPPQHIEKLRKLIQAGSADKISDARFFRTVRKDLIPDHPGFKFHLEQHAVRVIVLGGIFLFPFLRVQIHGSDLIDLEGLSVLPDPGLLEQQRPRRGFFDFRPDDHQQKQRSEASEEPAGKVHDPFEEGVHGSHHIEIGGQHIVASDGLHRLLIFVHALNRDVQMDGQRHLPALSQQLAAALVQRRAEEEYLIGPLPAQIFRRVGQIGDHRHPVYPFALCLPVDQHQPRHVIALEGVFLHALENARRGGGVRHDQNVVLRFLAAGMIPKKVFPRDPDSKGGEEIKCQAAHKGAQGDGFRLPPHRQRRGSEDQQINRMPQGGGKLFVVSTGQHMLQGVHRDDHKQVGHSQDQHHLGRLLIQQRSSAVPPPSDGKKQAHEKAQLVEHNKIQMLHPAVNGLFIHAFGFPARRIPTLGTCVRATAFPPFPSPAILFCCFCLNFILSGLT